MREYRTGDIVVFDAVNYSFNLSIEPPFFHVLRLGTKTYCRVVSVDIDRDRIDLIQKDGESLQTSPNNPALRKPNLLERVVHRQPEIESISPLFI